MDVQNKKRVSDITYTISKLNGKSKQYKEAERQKWDNVASGWQKWWSTIERGAVNLSKRLIELAEIKIGSRVLDISTGIGEPAITAASQLGKTGYILATDISPQMLSIAKQRATSLGLENLGKEIRKQLSYQLQHLMQHYVEQD